MIEDPKILSNVKDVTFEGRLYSDYSVENLHLHNVIYGASVAVKDCTFDFVESKNYTESLDVIGNITINEAKDAILNFNNGGDGHIGSGSYTIAGKPDNIFIQSNNVEITLYLDQTRNSIFHLNGSPFMIESIPSNDYCQILIEKDVITFRDVIIRSLPKFDNFSTIIFQKCSGAPESMEGKYKTTQRNLVMFEDDDYEN